MKSLWSALAEIPVGIGIMLIILIWSDWNPSLVGVMQNI